MVRVKFGLRLLLNMRVQVEAQRLANEFGHCFPYGQLYRERYCNITVMTEKAVRKIDF